MAMLPLKTRPLRKVRRIRRWPLVCASATGPVPSAPIPYLFEEIRK
jgi:hypothetical protein